MERITQEELDEQLMKLVNNELSDWADEEEDVSMLILNKDISGLSFKVLNDERMAHSIKIEGCDMSGCDMSDVMVEGLEIVDTITDGMNMTGHFRYGNFIGLNFDNCDILGRFQESNFIECSFKNANMSNCDFTGTYFEDCVFDGADMSGNDICEARWENCSFKNVDFSYSVFDSSEDYWNVVNCEFDGAIFDNVEIQGKNLKLYTGADLSNAIFTDRIIYWR